MLLPTPGPHGICFAADVASRVLVCPRVRRSVAGGRPWVGLQRAGRHFGVCLHEEMLTEALEETQMSNSEMLLLVVFAGLWLLWTRHNKFKDT